MSPQPYIDGFEFAASADRRSGRWPLHALPRLRASLADDSGELRYELRGTRDALGRQALRLKVDGVLTLSCQRCLETMAYPIEIDAILVLAASQAEIDGDADDLEAPDRVLASREMPIGDLIEEEVLLAMPFAPRHERCGARQRDVGERRASPFAGLSELLEASPADARNRRR
jgi:uncharacterized protein